MQFFQLTPTSVTHLTTEMIIVFWNVQTSTIKTISKFVQLLVVHIIPINAETKGWLTFKSCR